MSTTVLFEIPEFLKREPLEIKSTDIETQKYEKWVVPKKKKEKPTPKIKVVEKKEISKEMKNKLVAWGLVSDIEDILFATLEDKDEITSVSRIVKMSGASRKQINDTAKRFKELSNELAQIDSDEDITEAYSWLTEKQKKNVKDLARTVEIILKGLVSGKKAMATQAVKKSQRIEKLTQSVKFQAEFNALGITSLDPAEVIGSRVLVTYDTKRRQVTVFKATEGEKLTFSGTTLQNFDEERSFQKTVRKPQDCIPSLVDATEKRVTLVVGDLAAKPQRTTGRTRNEMVFLRTFK